MCPWGPSDQVSWVETQTFTYLAVPELQVSPVVDEVANTVNLPRPRRTDQSCLPPAGVVHTEHVDVPLDVVLFHHLPEDLPGHVTPVQRHGQVEGSLAPERKAEVEAALSQLPDGGVAARADRLLELAQQAWLLLLVLVGLVLVWVVV